MATDLAVAGGMGRGEYSAKFGNIRALTVIIAPLFYDIWGWIQLELGKNGECQMPRTQRYERQLEEYCRINKCIIIGKEYDSQINVRYLIKEESDGEKI